MRLWLPLRVHRSCLRPQRPRCRRSLSRPLAPLPGGRLAYGVFSPSGLALFTIRRWHRYAPLLLPIECRAASMVSRRTAPLRRQRERPGRQRPREIPMSDIFLPFRNPDRALNLGCTGRLPDGRRLACGVWARKKADQARNGSTRSAPPMAATWTRVTSPGDAFDESADDSPDGRRSSSFAPSPSTIARHPDGVVNVDGSNAHA